MCRQTFQFISKQKTQTFPSFLLHGELASLTNKKGRGKGTETDQKEAIVVRLEPELLHNDLTIPLLKRKQMD